MILSNSYINLRIRISPDSLAQLGERHLDRVEVAGSSPVGIIGVDKNKTLLHQRLLMLIVPGFSLILD